MISSATTTRRISSSQSIRLVQVTAVLACLFGTAVLSWQFSRFLMVFPGPALLAIALEIPLLLVGFVVFRLLRPARTPA